MLFPVWVRGDESSAVPAQPRGTLKRIERETGVGYSTLQRAMRREPIVAYDTLVALSAATGGRVSIDELAHPERYSAGGGAG